MRDLTLSMTRLAAYDELEKAVREGRNPVMAVGLGPVNRAQLAAILRLTMDRPVLMITADDAAAQRSAADLGVFLEERVLTVPSRELTMADAFGQSHQYEQARIAALSALGTARTVVIGAAALQQRTMPPESLRKSTITLSVGQEIAQEALTEQLVQAGYERTVQVEGPGQFAVRGGIVDLFPPQEKAPVRIEFWDVEIDSMSYFDVGSQRRGASVEELRCLPCRETLPHHAPGGIEGLCKTLTAALSGRKKKHPDLERCLERDIERLRETGDLPSADKYLPQIYPKGASVLDYLAPDTIIVFDETPRVRDAANAFETRMVDDLKALVERGELPQQPDGFALAFDALCRALKPFTIVRADPFLNAIQPLEPRALSNFTVVRSSPFGGAASAAAADVSSALRRGKQVCVLCASELRCRAMQDELRAQGIDAPVSDKIPVPGRVHIMEGAISAGFELPETGLVVLAEGFGGGSRTRSRSKKSSRDHVKSYTDLVPGDLVVHEHHGIGRFIGMERITVSGAERDYVKIAFAGTDTLYVPATSLDLISKYIGGGEPEKVRLNKLGGAEWQRARSKARAAVKALATDLVALYAARSQRVGYAFPPDDVWQREFEESFAYEETEDQLRCAAEIKADMEDSRPMDRLLCGDVGFGKTEVALRAVMKCVTARKQAAILVPTTVLARQHYLTALERFAPYSMNIELLSRYKTVSEQKKVLEKLQTGEIQLIIGTHKLFNKKVVFKDLGLLIIDEEQRFGVGHKETLKDLYKNVDVLTLSATPIPRTLNMALSGIRDMSTIEEPPHDRQPVQTYVLEYDEHTVEDAIRRELDRGGQVYYLHNIVESIDRVATRLQEHFPEARIAVIHGKMGQRELSRTMSAMSDGEIDILVCTTIIETGIDIPNANTLIIENADHMGLAQLHQIRGRVGRSHRRAYAYLTFRRGAALSEIAQKRLSAIREFAEFGSGFKIAMRDLEIRGAGNVLGPEQSGHLMSIGYDLYLKMLEEAVEEERGETPAQRVECAADLTISANLPADYVADAGQRIDLYRRIALIRTEDQRSDLLDELIDRYGDPPEPAVALLDVALLRARASDLGVSEIKQENGRLMLTFANSDFVRLSALCADSELRGRLLLNAGSIPYVSLRLNSGEKELDMAAKLLTKYADTEKGAPA